MASLRYEATPDLALYTSAGRGFETPTLNELSYRADGIGGLNFALQPSVNDQRRGRRQGAPGAAAC